MPSACSPARSPHAGGASADGNGSLAGVPVISNRSSRPISRLAIAMAAVAVLALAGCSGGGGGTQLSDGNVRSNADEGAPSDGDTPPELLADKEIPTACANALGTGDPAFEAAFCDYREAA